MEVAGIEGGVFLVNEDGGGSFPVGRDIFCGETMLKHTGQDLAFRIQ